ncbi:hypothetical protein C366_06536 [Cryptococcus neoformans Tu401-1]|nr:hypothetical protein C366_06536 [Cryptococcus neoformans var. grubii Tu401-1]
MAPTSTQDLRTPLGTGDTNHYRLSASSLAFDKSPTAFPSFSPVTPARSFFAHPKPPNMIQSIDEPVLAIDSPADTAACLDTLEKNLDALSPFQQRPMSTFREQDFSNGPAMAQALGRHLPQAMTDLTEIMNKGSTAFVSVAEDMEELKVQIRRSRKQEVLWRPNWENLRNAFFGNLVDAAVKACEDDRKNLKLECPSTEGTRDRVVA